MTKFSIPDEAKELAESITRCIAVNRHEDGSVYQSDIHNVVYALIPVLTRAKAAGAEEMREPILDAELEESATGDDPLWHIKALKSLAKQLGFANDFYYPLLGAAQLLEEHTRKNKPPGGDHD